jgi:hypothetical protein
MRHAMRIGLCLTVTAALSGCAAMMNPGGVARVSPGGGSPPVKMAALDLVNMSRDVSIYEGNRLLPIAETENQDLLRIHRAMCAEPCATYAYAHIYLDRSGPHTLRLTGGGREGTVTVERGLHVRWIFFDALWGPAAFVAWAVDGATGSWSYYRPLDVRQVLSGVGTR